MPEGDTIHNAASRVRRGAGGDGDPRRSRRRIRGTGMDRWPERLAGPARPRRRRPRQAPVPALRGRPHAALAPAHGRLVGRLPPRASAGSAAAPRLARDPHRRARGRAVRRARARADDRRPHPLRPAPRRPRARRAGRRLRRARASSRGCARTTRRARSATRCSTSATSPGIGNIWKAEGCFRGADRPVAAAGDVTDDEALAVVRAIRPLMQRLGRATRLHGARPAGSIERAGSALPALRHADPVARPGRRQPHHLLVPGLPAREARRPQGRRPGRARQHRRELRGGARARRGHDRVRRAAASSDGRLVLAHDYEDADRRARR